MASVTCAATKSSDIKRQKITYHSKFGGFITQLSGLGVNAQNDIIIVNTNYIIKIFDKNGRFKFQFVACRDKTLQPSNVAVCKKTGDILVTEGERSHQVRIFSKEGKFLLVKACQGLAVMDDGNVVLASQEETNNDVYLYIYKYTQVHPSPPTPRHSTSPFPRFEDQRSYVCVTNDEGNMGGFIHLPLCPDYSLSASTLKKVFPEATGLYYYSADNLILGVFRNEEKLFPPRSGDTILYITKKMSNLAQTDFKAANEGTDSRKGQLVCPGESDTSGLKQTVHEMRLAMNQMRREISDLKEEQNASKSVSELDVNAHIFEPATVAVKGDKTYGITTKETEEDTVHDDNAKNSISEDAVKDAIAEVGTKKNDNRTNTPGQSWQLQGLTDSYNPPMKEASNPVVRGTKGETLCQTEEYRREKIRLQSSDSSQSGAGSSLSGDSFISLKRLSIEQESVKPRRSVESQNANLHLGHTMGGVKMEPDLLETVSYKTSENRCFSVTGDKAVDVNSLRLPTKARGRNIKILKGVKPPGGIVDK